jgi:hypothetical protein
MTRSTPRQPSSDLLKPAAPADEPPAEAGVVSYAEYEAWEFVHFLTAHLGSLETRAAIIMPAQVAALIALWTQLYTFEEDLPHALAWAAWAALLLGLVGAAWLITPHRLQRTSLLGYGLHARPASSRAQIVEELSAIIQQRVRRLHIGLIVSVGLTVLALGLAVLAYVVDKAFYGG